MSRNFKCDQPKHIFSAGTEAVLWLPKVVPLKPFHHEQLSLFKVKAPFQSLFKVKAPFQLEGAAALAQYRQ